MAFCFCRGICPHKLNAIKRIIMQRVLELSDTHEIALMMKTDAEELIAFTEMLLKFIYEFPSRVPGP
jgi:hypothetical protein